MKLIGLSARQFGALTAAVTLLIDQTHKIWMIDVFQIANRGRVEVTPFLDLVMAWNTGVSYSLFRAESDLGRYALLAVALLATLALGVWLWRSEKWPLALGLGMIIGGALGNAYDRWAYGAVADFFYFHLGSFSWYVFNVADVAIVAGVGLLLYDSFLAKPEGSAPSV